MPARNRSTSDLSRNYTSLYSGLDSLDHKPTLYDGPYPIPSHCTRVAEGRRHLRFPHSRLDYTSGPGPTRYPLCDRFSSTPPQFSSRTTLLNSRRAWTALGITRCTRTPAPARRADGDDDARGRTCTSGRPRTPLARHSLRSARSARQPVGHETQLAVQGVRRGVGVDRLELLVLVGRGVRPRVAHRSDRIVIHRSAPASRSPFSTSVSTETPLRAIAPPPPHVAKSRRRTPHEPASPLLSAPPPHEPASSPLSSPPPHAPP